jgi:pentatricopeptide repeat protein
MYSSFGSGCICDARKMFDGMSMSTGDVALWNAMLNGYAKHGDLCNARDLFERMPQRNVISWTALITGYAQANRPHDAIALFRRMQLENVEPDEIAMLVALTACARLGALELGEWIRHYIDRLGLLTTNIPLNNALIDMYAKSGEIKRALQVFENMNHKTIITWTTMIAGLALHGLGTEALEMFSRMERARVKPNDITFIAILSACSHVGLVQTGRWYFNRMISRYGIEPKIEHYGCMIDLLGRAGHLKEAQTLLAQMPFEPNAVIWGSLLAACNTHGDPELGELALQHLLELEPDNSGNYALLSNIYASRGRWNESRVVRKVMWDAGVKKMPGGSLIEVNNRVHEFIAGEISHSQFDRIQEVLSKINRQLGLSQHFEKESGALLELG